jgi:hypothetical protein
MRSLIKLDCDFCEFSIDNSDTNYRAKFRRHIKRHGASLPPAKTGPKTEFFELLEVGITKEQLDRLDTFCQDTGRARRDVIRHAIDKLLNSYVREP